MFAWVTQTYVPANTCRSFLMSFCTTYSTWAVFCDEMTYGSHQMIIHHDVVTAYVAVGLSPSLICRGPDTKVRFFWFGTGRSVSPSFLNGLWKTKIPRERRIFSLTSKVEEISFSRPRIVYPFKTRSYNTHMINSYARGYLLTKANHSICSRYSLYLRPWRKGTLSAFDSVRNDTVITYRLVGATQSYLNRGCWENNG